MSRVGAYSHAPGLRPGGLVGLAVLFAALAGALIFLIMDSLSRSSIGGATWNLRGNGALIVPFALGPTVLSMAWVGLAQSFRGDSRWAAFAIAAGALTLAIELLIGFGPIIFGPDAGQWNRLLVGVIAPLLAQGAGLALAMTSGRLSGRGVMASSIICLLTISLTYLLPGLESLIVPLVVPIVLTAPLVPTSRESSVWLVVSAIAVPAALVGGFIVAQTALSSPP